MIMGSDCPVAQERCMKILCLGGSVLAVQAGCSSDPQTSQKSRIGVGSSWEADMESLDTHTHCGVEIVGNSPAGSGMLFGDEVRLNES